MTSACDYSNESCYVILSCDSILYSVFFFTQCWKLSSTSYVYNKWSFCWSRVKPRQDETHTKVKLPAGWFVQKTQAVF